jgi:hypothetical protein
MTDPAQSEYTEGPCPFGEKVKLKGKVLELRDCISCNLNTNGIEHSQGGMAVVHEERSIGSFDYRPFCRKMFGIGDLNPFQPPLETPGRISPDHDLIAPAAINPLHSRNHVRYNGV